VGTTSGLNSIARNGFSPDFAIGTSFHVSNCAALSKHPQTEVRATSSARLFRLNFHVMAAIRQLLHKSGQEVLKAFAIAIRARDWYSRQRPEGQLLGKHRSQFYSAVWREAAAEVGANVELLHDDVFEIRLGQALTRTRQTATAADDPVTLDVAANKPLVYRLLSKRGLRIPNYCEFTLGSIGQAIAYTKQFAGEWVVKPANGAAGRGATTGVVTAFDLVRAAIAAAAYDSNLLVEQQAQGDVYRLLYLNGKLLDAVQRSSPSVLADGRSSIRKLIQLENQARLKSGPLGGQTLIRRDLDLHRTLAKQGLSLCSVPKRGTVVTLKTVINENSAADNVSATGKLCHSIIEDGAAAADAIGVRLAGVDVITPDPRVPLEQSGGIILEVNTTPGYHYHYHRRDRGIAVAIPILSSLLLQATEKLGSSGEPGGAKPPDAVIYRATP